MERRGTINESEITRTKNTLLKLIPLKNIPQRIFDIYQKVFGGTSLEVVPVRVAEDGEISIFLVDRPQNDTYWPNKKHVPGTMVFPWDTFLEYINPKMNGFANSWDRLKRKEFMKNIEDNSILPASTILLDTKRGAETAVVYAAIVDDDLPDGKFYKLTDLPDSLIEHHLPIIREGVLTFVGSLMTGRFSRPDITDDKIDYMTSQIHNILRYEK